MHSDVSDIFNPKPKDFLESFATEVHFLRVKFSQFEFELAELRKGINSSRANLGSVSPAFLEFSSLKLKGGGLFGYCLANALKNLLRVRSTPYGKDDPIRVDVPPPLFADLLVVPGVVEIRALFHLLGPPAPSLNAVLTGKVLQRQHRVQGHHVPSRAFLGHLPGATPSNIYRSATAVRPRRQVWWPRGCIPGLSRGPGWHRRTGICQRG